MCALSLVLASGLLSTPAALPQEPSGLLPTDAAVIVRLESLDAAHAAISRLAGIFGSAESVPPKEMFLTAALQLPIDTAQIDPARPIYMATDIVMGPPMPAFLLPARDVDGLTSSIAATGKTPVVRGDWLGFSMQPKYEPADANPRADAMLPGVLSASIDLVEVIEMFGGLIEMGLAQAEAQIGQQTEAAAPGGLDMQALMALYFEGFRTFMDCAEGLDLALHEDGEELALHGVFTALEDSELDGWSSAGALPETLPAAFDDGAQIAFVMVADWSDLMARLQPVVEAMLEAYPEEARAGFHTYWVAINEAYALLGDVAVGAGGFGEQGMHFAFHSTAKDGAAFVEKLSSAFASASALANPMGVTLGAPQTIEVGGTKAQQWPIEIDYGQLAQVAGQAGGPEAAAGIEPVLARIYGEHPTLTVGEKSGHVCVAFGGGPAELERAFARLTAGPVPAAPFLAGLRGAPASLRPLLAYHVDFGAVLEALRPLMAAQGVPDEIPAVDLDLTTWFGIEGRRWHMGLGADVDQLAAMAATMKQH
jgi:hypothetical protein